MATQPKPKPKPEPEPKPDDDDAAVIEEPPQPATLEDRVDALFASHVALTERVERLEERQNAPPIGIGRRP